MQISRKVILLGRFGVGKTSLVKRFIYERFDAQYLSTIGVKVDKKIININGVSLNMLIWDIAGETETTKVPAAYQMGAHGVLFVFDVTRPASYVSVRSEIEHIQISLPNVPIQLIGNKIDLLTENQLNALRDKIDLKDVMYTSAKVGRHINDAFYRLGEAILQ